jgi:hypothetical protein
VLTLGHLCENAAHKNGKPVPPYTHPAE